MSANLGVVAPTGDGQNAAGKGRKPRRKQTFSARKEATNAAKMLMERMGAGGGEGRSEHTAVPDATADPEKKPLYVCGFEDTNDEEWSAWEHPPRIRESRLTPEERAKFQGHLKQIFSYETAVLSDRLVFAPEDVMEVMQKVVPYLKSEPVLIEDVPFPINIVADIHGQLYDLHRIFKGDEKDGKPGWECKKYIFLGDYVDRGRQSLEVIMALFCIKMLQPDDIFLLRGNHEFVTVNSEYGFDRDIGARYEKSTAFELYLTCNTAFCYLSIAAILGDKYFCAHGGISPAAFTREKMRTIYKPIVCNTEDMLIQDLVWSDPAVGLKATVFNADRSSTVFFGLDTLGHCLETMGVKAIFRGHSRMQNGYNVIWHCLVSLFSATDTQGQNNKGAVAQLDENGKLSFRVLLVCPKRRVYEAGFRKKRGKRAVEDDPKTECDMGTGATVQING